MKIQYTLLFASLLSANLVLPVYAAGVPCSFDKTKTCHLQRDILNDVAPNGLRYYSPVNSIDRKAFLVTTYADNVNAPGQIRVSGQAIPRTRYWYTGEITTGPSTTFRSNPWTTRDAGSHGYIEVVLKNAKCETSDDGLCQTKDLTKYPKAYNYGLWPAISLRPWNNVNTPVNGSMHIMESYAPETEFLKADTTMHFKGSDDRCQEKDCGEHGYHLGGMTSKTPLYDDYHVWGFEWQADAASKTGGMIITGYFDGVRAWGPVSTDTLPAEGPATVANAFNDANGGYYLDIDFVVGGYYPGPIDSHVKSAAMYIQSVKAYTVD